MKPKIKITASESCTCSKQTSSGFDGSDTNSSMPQGINCERRSASWADSRSGRRSLNIELTKIRIRLTVAHYSRRDAGTAHAPAHALNNHPDQIGISVLSIRNGY